MSVARFASPAAFGMLLLLFLLMPFLSVSCDVPGSGEYGASYRGVDLATGATPGLEGAEELRATAEELAPGGDTTLPPAGVQLLAIVTGLLLVAGSATPLLRRARALVAAVAAVLAAAAAVLTQVVAQDNVRAAVLARLPEDLLSDVDNVADVADALVRTDIGFWLVLTGLGMTAVLNVGVLLLERRLRAESRGP